MYFLSRSDAGQQLAERLKDLVDDEHETIVLAVKEGAVVVGAQIAAQLHCMLTMLMIKNIVLPDGKTTIGMVNDMGGFVYNESIPLGTVIELAVEYHNSIELSKLQALRDLHQVVGGSGLVEKEFFRNKNVIVVSDGVRYGNAFSATNSYLHGIAIHKLILVAPIVSVAAIDKMHVMGDRIEVIRTVPEYFDTDHYYEDNQIPSSKEISNYLHNIIDHWKGIGKESVKNSESA